MFAAHKSKLQPPPEPPLLHPSTGSSLHSSLRRQDLPAALSAAEQHLLQFAWTGTLTSARSDPVSEQTDPREADADPPASTVPAFPMSPASAVVQPVAACLSAAALEVAAGRLSKALTTLQSQSHAAEKTRKPARGVDPLILLQQAFASLALGDAATARLLAERVATCGDADLMVDAQVCCGLACSALGLHQAVLVHLEALSDLQGMEAELFIFIADAYRGLGQPLRAVVYYDRFLSSHPRRFDIHRRKLGALWQHLCSLASGSS